MVRRVGGPPTALRRDSVYFRDPDGNLLELMAADEDAAWTSANLDHAMLRENRRFSLPCIPLPNGEKATPGDRQPGRRDRAE